MINQTEKKVYQEIVSTTQAQTTGAFIGTLNEIRLHELVKRYAEIDCHKAGADQELQALREEIKNLIESNRGGTTGMHGFIGERVQVSFSNARAVMQGQEKAYTLIDDNGMTDYLRGNTLIQQKACLSDKALGLTHVAAHAEKYPAFIQENGIYQIPKDFYAKYQRFVNMAEETALKLRKEDLRMWKRVQEFKAAVPEAKVEPMVVTYDEIQAGAVNGTIDREMAAVEKEYRKQRNAAENACKPTVQEGLKVAAYSAALEGIVDGSISILEHKQERGKIRDFEKEDWKEIGIDIAKGIGKGAIRGTAVYAATNIVHVPADVASATVTGAFGVIEKSSRYIKGECTGKECAIGIADRILSCAFFSALTAHRESRQQQAREAERQMAMQPLAPPSRCGALHEGVKVQAAEENVPLQSDSASEPVTQEDSPGEPPMAELSESEIEALIRGAVPIAYEKPLPQSNEQPRVLLGIHGPGPASPYQSVLHDLEYMIPMQGFVDKMTVLLNMGISRFTSLEWGEMHLVSAEEALADCDALYAAGIADRYLRNGRHMYLLRFESSDELAQMVRDGKIPPAASGGASGSAVGRDDFWVHLASMETSRSDAIRRAAGIVRDMISEGIRSFTRESWIERTGRSAGAFASAKILQNDCPEHRGEPVKPQRVQHP